MAAATIPTRTTQDIARDVKRLAAEIETLTSDQAQLLLNLLVDSLVLKRGELAEAVAAYPEMMDLLDIERDWDCCLED